MDRNQAKEFYPILQAYAEGRVIECRTKPSAIEDENVPNEWAEIKVIEFNGNKEYRIKPNLEPESEYRPFKDAIECWTEMRKHKPFSILKDKKDGHRIQISSISDGINSISSSPDSNFCCDFKYRMDSCTNEQFDFISKLKQDLKQLEDEKRQVKESIIETLLSLRTTKRAIKEFPDAAPYLQEYDDGKVTALSLPIKTISDVLNKYKK